MSLQMWLFWGGEGFENLAFQQMKQPPGPGTETGIVQLRESCVQSVPLEVTVKGSQKDAWCIALL